MGDVVDGEVGQVAVDLTGEHPGPVPHLEQGVEETLARLGVGVRVGLRSQGPAEQGVVEEVHGVLQFYGIPEACALEGLNQGPKGLQGRQGRERDGEIGASCPLGPCSPLGPFQDGRHPGWSSNRRKPAGLAGDPLLPILRHQLARPPRLADLLPRQKLGHHGLDVEHRRALDGVEAGDGQGPPLAAEDADDGRSQPVGTVLAALGEDPDPRPVRVPPGMAGAALDGVLRTRICSRPSEVCSKPREVCSRPSKLCSRPSEVWSRSREVCSKPGRVCVLVYGRIGGCVETGAARSRRGGAVHAGSWAVRFAAYVAYLESWVPAFRRW